MFSPSNSLAYKTILSNVDVVQLSLKTECLPILIGIHKFRHLTALKSTEDTNRIACFIANNKKCPDIELYWSQAVKLLSALKPVVSRTTANFESAKPIDHFWIVHSHLASTDLLQSEEVTNIFNVRAYLRVLHNLLPILVSCSPLSELPLLLKPLVASNLSAEHISNLAVNLPSICGSISDVLQSYLRDSQEPALLWRCSRILLKISSCDKQLAVTVRNSLVRRKEHPLLCLEITRRFIHDSEMFTDNELCCNFSSPSISNSWLLGGLRDTDLIAISLSAADQLRVLLCGSVEAFANDHKQWKTNVNRYVRIIATCNSVQGCISSSTTSADPSLEKLISTKSAIVLLIEAAECVRRTLCQVSSCAGDDQKEFVEFVIRQAIVLLVVSFNVVASAASKTRGDSNLRTLGSIHNEETILAALLTSALKTQEQLIELGVGDLGSVETARCFKLCFRLAVTFGSHYALRTLCVTELCLDHYVDFLPVGGEELPKIMAVLARIMLPPHRTDRRASHSVLCDEFAALEEPSVVSGSYERAGDWVGCLSLMLSCDLMSTYEDPHRRTVSASANGRLNSGGEEGIEIDSAKEDKQTGGTHKLMMRVLSRTRYPPHSLLQTCIDRWLIRCVGVGLRISNCAGRVLGNDKECRNLGLPLLQNEVRTLCKGLIDATKHPVEICRECGLARNLESQVVRWREEEGAVSSAVLSDNCRGFLERCEVSTRFWNTDTSACADDSDTEDSEDSIGGSPCLCSSSSSSIDSTTNINSDSSGSDDSGWRGVLSCYSALYYASQSMALNETVSTIPTRSCEVMYLGPYVCDVRSLPIKRALQFLLMKYARRRTCPQRAQSRIGTKCTAAFTTSMLSKIVDLTSRLCPELLLPDRGRCFLPLYLGSAERRPHSDDVTASALPTPPTHSEKEESELILQTIFTLTSAVGGTEGPMPQYSFACQLVSRSRFATALATSLSPSSVLGRLLQHLLTEALDSADDRQQSAGLWRVWRAVHDSHPSPQQVELLTLNLLTSTACTTFSRRMFSSYEQLVQEPLLLFNLSFGTLSGLFVLRLVVFVTRAALTASKCAVQLSLAIKHRVAEGFVTADLRHRSIAEASLYLHEDMFLDLQDVMAMRMLLALWDAWGEDTKPRSTHSEQRLVLNNFLSSLMIDNPRLCNLLLCHQLTPRSFELLLSCDISVARLICTNHVLCIEEITKAFKVVPTAAAIAIDPLITSSSIIFATTAIAASALATVSEVSPEHIERLLLHSLCILRLSPKISQDGEASRTIAVIAKLAEALPSFILTATNSLNAHLASSDLKPIEQHTMFIVKELFECYPALAAPLRDFALSSERVVTANTAALSLATKSWGNKGHSNKLEEDITMKFRPPVAALRKIIRKIEVLHPKALTPADPLQDDQKAHTAHTGAPVLGKTPRLDDELGTEDLSRKKIKTA